MSGRITESFHLHCVGVVDEGDWIRLLDTLTDMYKVYWPNKCSKLAYGRVCNPQPTVVLLYNTIYRMVSCVE